MAQRYRSGRRARASSRCAVPRVAHSPTSASANLSTSARAVTASPGAVRVEDGSGDGVYARGRRRDARGETSRKKLRQRAATGSSTGRPLDHTSPRRVRGLATHEGRGVLERGEDEPKTSSEGPIRRSIQPCRHRPRRDSVAAAEGGVPTPPSQVLRHHERRRVALLFSRCLFSNPPGNPRGVFSRENAQPARRVRRHKSSGGGVVARHHERR